MCFHLLYSLLRLASGLSWIRIIFWNYDLIWTFW